MQNVGKANLAGAMLPYYLSCNAHYQFDFCDTQSAYIDAYTHNSSCSLLIIITVYRVLYRNDRESVLSKLNFAWELINVYGIPKTFTLQQLTSDTQGLCITHMRIYDDIPPGLEIIAPNLKYLWLHGVPHSDQLKR